MVWCLNDSASCLMPHAFVHYLPRAGPSGRCHKPRETEVEENFIIKDKKATEQQRRRAVRAAACLVKSKGKGRLNMCSHNVRFRSGP